jgi:hypothetical protein
MAAELVDLCDSSDSDDDGIIHALQQQLAVAAASQANYAPIGQGVFGVLPVALSPVAQRAAVPAAAAAAAAAAVLVGLTDQPPPPPPPPLPAAVKAEPKAAAAASDVLDLIECHICMDTIAISANLDCGHG